VLRLGREALLDLERVTRLEWLLTDGLGGYASSTPVGIHTRRYHGLLVVATQPRVGRVLLLSHVDETLTIGDSRYELSTHAYLGAVHPRGHERASAFVLDPLPTLTWELPEGRLTRTIARVHGEPGVVLLYQYEGGAPARLELRPLVAYRGHHALQHENGALRRAVDVGPEDVVVWPDRLYPSLALRVPGSQWRGDAYWCHSFLYERERERGFDCLEDLWSPGVFEVPLRPRRPVALLAWAHAIPPARDAEALVNAERKRLRAQADGDDKVLGALRQAADAFVVRRGEQGRSVIAGYHWFEDWGRDAMIALPGLCLPSGRYEEARLILSEFARHLEGGLIPNRFPDAGQPPEYNTVDAALWMVVAIQRLIEATRERALVGRFLPVVAGVLEGYGAGTRHGIRVNPDGLVTQGEPGVQLTWMDAKVGDHVVTPRYGCPIEIQALWYNALMIGAELARAAGDARAKAWAEQAVRVKASVVRLFWSDQAGYLADVVADAGPDLSLRPNQLLAISLPHSLLPRDKALRLIESVRRDLLTPVGLRTLSPRDRAYRGRYAGGPDERDSAYHQGTVWPYLMGAYFDAVIRLEGERGKREAAEWLLGFGGHLEEAGLGYVSEVFDGDPPHAPGGAIAQAWSVAELLRVAHRLPHRTLSAGVREEGVGSTLALRDKG